MDDLDPAIISQLSDIFICYSMYNSLPQYINEITLHIVTIAKSCPIVWFWRDSTLYPQ